MPAQVWVLTLSAFAIGTAEFVIAGILGSVARSTGVTEGQAGWLITSYALAIVVGGPLLTIGLARFDRRAVLLWLLALFVGGNVLAAATQSFAVLLVARVLSGLTQGPFYGIGSVLASRLVPKQAGRAVGSMFAGLTLANVLGVPAGAWIGLTWGWNATFVVVAVLGALAGIAVALWIPRDVSGASVPVGIGSQLGIFRDAGLLSGLAITVVAWTGFMAFYGFVGPIGAAMAGIGDSVLAIILVVVGLGLLLGNALGGRTADRALERSLIGWPFAMSASLVLVALVGFTPWSFAISGFVFGVAAFANVPPMQLRVMRHGGDAPDLAATANISAFNLANAIGGVIGGVVVDSALGAAAIPWFAAVLPLLGIVVVLATRRHAARPTSDETAAPDGHRDESDPLPARRVEKQRERAGTPSMR